MFAARRRFAHLMFVLALLLAQQVLVVHPLVHGLGKSGGDDPSAPAERGSCVLCIAGFATGTALPSAAQPLLALPAGVVRLATFAWEYTPPVTLAFSSRAPPQFL